MSVLQRPILTEKITEQSGLGKYAFEVQLNADKSQIKHAIEKLYGVKVASVNTMRCIGKKKTRVTKRRYVSGKTSTYKKAIVRLAEGEVIDIYGEV